ncbi:MAG: flagellar assembly protein FliW, partial [Methylococcaceae bacterium]
VLGIENIADTLILIILHKDENAQLTVKGAIKSPLVINSVKRIGLQKVFAEVEQSITLTENSNEINFTER